MMAGVLQDLHNLPRQHTSPRQQLHAASCAAPAVAQAPAAASSSMAAPQPASTQELLPVFDLAAFLALAPGQQPPPELMQQCRDVARCLEETGCVVVRDPRVPASANDAFLDLMEGYFGRSEADKARDARPELAYQVGVTPGGVEVPRCVADPDSCASALAAAVGPNAPTMPHGPDAKWRFFWRVGRRPAATAFPELNAPPVVPRGLPCWPSTMDGWGQSLLGAVTAVARMAALGWGIRKHSGHAAQQAGQQDRACSTAGEAGADGAGHASSGGDARASACAGAGASGEYDADAFARLMEGGPHLLAPTGSDLAEHGALGSVLAGFHYDLNFITIHGRSRFPGLFVWLADGTRAPVAIPHGCLLCQAGKQLEWLTGGRVKAGMHEVVVTEATQAAVAAARAAGRSCWRVSSTLFAHIASDVVLQPLPEFVQAQQQQQQQQQSSDDTAAAAAVTAAAALALQAQYPPTPAGLQVQRELEAIQLRKA